jgi:transposase-like protein
MEAMTRHRSHSAAFKRQVAQEFVAGETLHALAKRHDVSRQLIRIWVGQFEAGALDDDVQAADLIQEYEAKIAALERMVGRQALELELLKGGFEACTPAEKREHLRRHRPRGISVARGCELMGLSRSTFYDATPTPLDDNGILARIGAICDEFECYG